VNIVDFHMSWTCQINWPAAAKSTSQSGDDSREHVRRRGVLDEQRAGLMLHRQRHERAGQVVILAP
jgi:hypothetical protein